MDGSLPRPSVLEIFQARILEWVAISFSRGASGPRDQTFVSWQIFYNWATREAFVFLGKTYCPPPIFKWLSGKPTCDSSALKQQPPLPEMVFGSFKSTHLTPRGKEVSRYWTQHLFLSQCLRFRIQLRTILHKSHSRCTASYCSAFHCVWDKKEKITSAFTSMLLLLLLSHFSRVRLCATPPGSPVPGILQARTLEWVAISFSDAWKWKVKVKSLSRVRLFATPWTAAYQAPPSMGFPRQEYWSGVPLPSLTSMLMVLKCGVLKVGWIPDENYRL